MRFLICVLVLVSSIPAKAQSVLFAHQAPTVDGVNNEEVWQQAAWHPMPYLLVGSEPEKTDFDGRFRLIWDQNFLYLQVEIVDDVLIDVHADPLKRYWDDDCLEIFIDEDASGGNHQYNHNAFAYHIALDNQAVDMGEDEKPHLYNDHLISRWQRSSSQPNKIVWEVAIRLFDDTFKDGQTARPVTLYSGKEIGFMLAYCDNDGSEFREHFMASTNVKPVNGDKNRGWIDASVFAKIKLTGSNEQ